MEFEIVILPRWCEDLAVRAGKLDEVLAAFERQEARNPGQHEENARTVAHALDLLD